MNPNTSRPGRPFPWTILAIIVGVGVGALIYRRSTQAARIAPDVTSPKIVGAPEPEPPTDPRTGVPPRLPSPPASVAATKPLAPPAASNATDPEPPRTTPPLGDVAPAVPARAAGQVTTLVSGAPADRLRGTVVLTGTPPAEKPIAPLMADANCGKLVNGTVTTRHYVVGANNGLANVFVRIAQGLEGRPFEAPSKATVIDQIGCLYEPYVSGAMAGAPVEFRNSDPVLHNVNFMKSSAGNTPFNTAQGPGAKPITRIFPNPEVLVKVQCNIHPWMFGYIGVVAHPYFAVTDANGAFELPPGLPPGKYTVEATHLKAGTTSAEIEVTSGGVLPLRLELGAR